MWELDKKQRCEQKCKVGRECDGNDSGLQARKGRGKAHRPVWEK